MPPKTRYRVTRSPGRLLALLSLLLLLPTALPPVVRAQTTGVVRTLSTPAPGPLRTLLLRPVAGPAISLLPAVTAPTRSLPSFQSSRKEPPPTYQPFLSGLAAKLLLDGAIVYMAGDVFHAFPALILMDPALTAFGVHMGDRQLGSFPWDAIASYGSLFLCASLLYGYDVGGGEFVEGESYHGLWVSMGVQLFATTLMEKHTARRRGR
jgi:hypothetical protein